MGRRKKKRTPECRRLSPENFPMERGAGQISGTFDEQGRPLRAVYEKHGYPANHLQLDHDRKVGKYSDERYRAFTYDDGRVEEIHLGEVASVRTDVVFAAWIEEVWEIFLRDTL